ncbi:hypothetical protein HQ587_01245 [bacterium]|nr:hypothetical protein [bacterium]
MAKSRVITWLFVFQIMIFGSCPASDGIITGLRPERSLSLDVGPTASGVAMTIDGSGRLYVLFDIPPRLLVWDANGTRIGEFSAGLDRLSTPVDLSSDGGLELLIVDPWHEQIMRLSHRLETLPPVVPDAGGSTLEPVSICRVSDGTLYFINRADDDIWRIDRSGEAFPLGWSPGKGNFLTQPLRIEYASSVNKLLILDNDDVKLASLHQPPGLPIKIRTEKPTAIGVFEDEAWIAGEGVSSVSLTSSIETFFVTPDSLRAWGAYPVVDVALGGYRQLYLLPEKGGQVVVLAIERRLNGHP